MCQAKTSFEEFLYSDSERELLKKRVKTSWGVIFWVLKQRARESVFRVWSKLSQFLTDGS